MTELEIEKLEKKVTGSDSVIVEEGRSVETLPDHVREDVRNVLPEMGAEKQAGSLDEEEVAIVMEIAEVIEKGRKDKLPAFRNVPKKKLLEEMGTDGQIRVFTHILNNSNTNLINNVNRNIDEQVKAIREEKHRQYLQNNSRESPSQENIVLETNKKNGRDKTNEQPNDTHNKITNSDINDRDNQCCWPSGICAIVGDSMINGIDEKRLSQNFGSVKVFHFSG